MNRVVIAVILSIVGPGLGQLYNKEFKKGAYLLVVSSVVMIAACVWFMRAMQQFLPPDLSAVDPSAIRGIVMNAFTQMKQSQTQTMDAYQLILLVLWGYSIFDAAKGAMRHGLQPPTQ